MLREWHSKGQTSWKIKTAKIKRIFFTSHTKIFYVYCFNVHIMVSLHGLSSGQGHGSFFSFSGHGNGSGQQGFLAGSYPPDLRWNVVQSDFNSNDFNLATSENGGTRSLWWAHIGCFLPVEQFLTLAMSDACWRIIFADWRNIFGRKLNCFSNLELNCLRCEMIMRKISPNDRIKVYSDEKF